MPSPTSPTDGIRYRWREADRIAQRLAWQAVQGRFNDHTWQWAGSITGHPVLERIVAEAPQVAATAAPGIMRVARTPRGQLTVVRLHGPDWSLVLTPGHPLPGYLVAVLDLHPGLDPPLSMLDPDWTPELTAMSAAILAAADK